MKMLPNLGFDPNDEIHEPVWEAIEAHGLACLSHCAYVAHGIDTGRMQLSSLTASPFHFEVPARRHPGINLIFAYFGGGATYLGTITLLRDWITASQTVVVAGDSGFGSTACPGSKPFR